MPPPGGGEGGCRYADRLISNSSGYRQWKSTASSDFSAPSECLIHRAHIPFRFPSLSVLSMPAITTRGSHELVLRLSSEG